MITSLIVLPFVLAWLAWVFTVGMYAHAARRYEPATGAWTGETDVVTAVYNDDPALFDAAVSSWARSGITRIIAVIDARSTACADVFSAKQKEFPRCTFVSLITEKPGKRPALVDGCALTVSDVVILADADTVWSPNFLPEILKPFSDPTVGGVSGRCTILKPRTLAQRASSAMSDFSSGILLKHIVATGQEIPCMNGQSSAFKGDLLRSVVGGLLTETYRGKQAVSGDDSYLTHAVRAAGWKTVYQATAKCSTKGLESVPRYWLQLVRWMRTVFRRRFQGYVTKKGNSLLITIRKYIQLLAPLSVPVAAFALIAHGQLPALLMVSAMWYATCVLMLTWSGYGIVRATTQAAPLLLGQVMTEYSMLFAYFTIEEDTWLSHETKEAIAASARDRSKISRFAYAFAVGFMFAAAYLYVALVPFLTALIERRP